MSRLPFAPYETFVIVLGFVTTQNVIMTQNVINLLHFALTLYNAKCNKNAKCNTILNHAILPVSHIVTTFCVVTGLPDATKKSHALVSFTVCYFEVSNENNIALSLKNK